jgi:hypothetical protein
MARVSGMWVGPFDEYQDRLQADKGMLMSP